VVAKHESLNVCWIVFVTQVMAKLPPVADGCPPFPFVPGKRCLMLALAAREDMDAVTRDLLIAGDPSSIPIERLSLRTSTRGVAWLCQDSVEATRALVKRHAEPLKLNVDLVLLRVCL